MKLLKASHHVYLSTISDTGRDIVIESVYDNIVTLDLPMGKTHNLVAVATDNVGNTPKVSDANFEKSIVEIYFPEIEGRPI